MLQVSDDAVFGMEDGSKIQRTVAGSSDGASSAALAWTGAPAEEGLSAKASFEETCPAGSAYDLSPQEEATLGLSYTPQDLKAQLDAVLSSDGARSLEGSAEGKLTESLKGDAKLSYARGSDGSELSRVGAGVAYDRDQTQAMLRGELATDRTGSAQAQVDHRFEGGTKGRLDARFDVADKRT